MLGILVIGVILFFLSRSTGRPELARLTAGAVPVVIVTVVDSTTFSEWYIDDIKANRMAYADRHGKIFPESKLPLGSNEA